jgi:hypothetical protein
VTRLALLVLVVFLLVGIVRVLRLFLVGAFRTGRGAAPGPREAEMIRDPVCGTWIDRRLAVFGRRGGEAVPVCSDDCRRRLEAG